MDQCMNCTVRGDIDSCMKTPCSQHESWYAQTLKSQQRKPLTDEQIETLWHEDTSCDMPDELKQFKHTARAIEVAHGIKE